MVCLILLTDGATALVSGWLVEGFLLLFVVAEHHHHILIEAHDGAGRILPLLVSTIISGAFCCCSAGNSWERFHMNTRLPPFKPVGHIVGREYDRQACCSCPESNTYLREWAARQDMLTADELHSAGHAQRQTTTLG